MVRIVFHHIGEEQKPYAGLFVDSVKRCMPNSMLVQVTDEQTRKVDGVDVVLRLKQDKPYSYEDHPVILLGNYIQIPFDEFITMDADMIVRKDISQVMNGDFDVAICGRDNVDTSTSHDFNYEHPYNGGFMALKSKRFLQDWYEAVLKISKTPGNLNISDTHKGFLRGQWILKYLIDSGNYKVKFLNPQIFNYTPQTKDDTNSFSRVFHYKGSFRKEWMQKFKHQGEV